jgi:ubiquinone/menaquinone biosynthesis C-methylase UbiE
MQDNSSTSRDTYNIGYGSELHTMMSQRAIATDAGFLLPHFRPGMRLLDCGSGPGTITLGLAEAVAPGEVIGIDVSPLQVERARTLAAEHGVDNVRFELGNIYELPFDDASFDVAWANAVLMHLREPVAALREMRRVVRPGGLVAVRDHGVHLREPRTPVIEQLFDLQAKVCEVTLGRSTAGLGMRHRELLHEAGLSRAEGFADATVYGNPKRLRETAAAMRGLRSSEETRRIAASLGYDNATQDRLSSELDAWYERPDAIVVIVWSAGLGWVE